MPKRPGGTEREPRPALHLLVTSPRKRRRLVGVARQHREERLEHVGPKVKNGRKLPQDRTELDAEIGDARREEVRKRLLAVAKLQHVRDEARTLDAEDEAVGRLVAPARVELGPLQRIKRAVDLDRR